MNATNSEGLQQEQEPIEDPFERALVKYLEQQQQQSINHQDMNYTLPSFTSEDANLSYRQRDYLPTTLDSGGSLESKFEPKIIFNPGGASLLIGLYGLILILGLLFNSAIIWVILARKQNRNPRNMYIVNLAISGIIMVLFCIPPTLLSVLYGGWWHLGVVSCKLVPVIQGANILVSAFTITVIAIDRWQSVTNTNPATAVLSYGSVFQVIALIWLSSFAVTSPLLVFSDVERMEMQGTVFVQICKEVWPNDYWKHSFTMVILLAQYVVPLLVLPIVHSKILIFLRKNSKFQTDARRREREVKRNRRMTRILSCIAIIYACSWIPQHLYLVLIDVFNTLQNEDQQSTFFLLLGLCHTVAMSTSFTNPVMYGWFNSSLRSELESILPARCRQCLHRSKTPRRGGLSMKDGGVNGNNIEQKISPAEIVKPSLKTEPNKAKQIQPRRDFGPKEVVQSQKNGFKDQVLRKISLRKTNKREGETSTFQERKELNGHHCLAMKTNKREGETSTFEECKELNGHHCWNGREKREGDTKNEGNVRGNNTVFKEIKVICANEPIQV